MSNLNPSQLASEREQIRKELVRALHDLPALPHIVSKVLELTDRETSSADEIEKYVRTEPALSSKFLQVVNSSYFGLSRQVNNLSQSIVILGQHQVRNLVLGISLVNAFKAHRIDTQKLVLKQWENSFTAARGATMVAKRQGLDAKQGEQVYLATLLMDIGQLFMVTASPGAFSIIKERDAAETDLETERELIGTDHVEVGKKLTQKWNLPEPIPSVVAHHEAPPEDQVNPEVYCAHAADRIVKSLLAGRGIPAAFGIAPHVSAWLGFSDEELAELAGEVQLEFERAREMINLAM